MYQLHTKKQAEHFEEVIRLHKKGHSPEQISRVIEVTSRTVRNWIAIFNGHKNLRNYSTMSSTKPPVTSTEAQLQDAQQEIRRLRRELSDALLHRDFLDEMIHVAEAQFNIPIRKKAGAKQ